MTGPRAAAGEAMGLAPQVSTHADPSGPTPAQTIGPFFRFGMAWMDAADLVPAGTPGSVVLTGRVLDGDGAAVPDAMVEIWQADGDGRLDGAGVGSGAWSGFGRSLTDDGGRYRFTTVVPGQVDERQAPHIDVSVFARGMLQRVVTRVYVPGHPANDDDPVLAAVGAGRAGTLLATREGPDTLLHDIRLQGERETVFFTW